MEDYLDKLYFAGTAAVLLANHVAQQGPSGPAAAEALMAPVDGRARPSSELRLTAENVPVAAAVAGKAHPRAKVTIAPPSANDGGEPRAKPASNDHDMALFVGGRASFKGGGAFVGVASQYQALAPSSPIALPAEALRV
ncbi:unnamed protein product [Prorocentrum cordatum]|uniref:Subtilisin n=1 Tax=Prorocentrum cordatum TaxID=2364126 RepID=A0ABN9UE80_9DINO|nr:unnamed protein product [Polarella glacialis]